MRKLILGDHPEQQFECGNAQGGDYPCPCGVKVHRFTDLCHVYRSKIISLEERRLKVS